MQITNDSGAMMTDLLGFAPTQLGAPTEATETIQAANAARIDKNRAVVFHCPSLGGGSYSTAGRMGGSALHMVPITVPLGAVHAFRQANAHALLAGTETVKNAVSWKFSQFSIIPTYKAAVPVVGQHYSR